MIANVGDVHIAMIKYEGRDTAVGAYRSETEAGLEARAALMRLLEKNGFSREGCLSGADGEIEGIGYHVITTGLYLPY